MNAPLVLGEEVFYPGPDPDDQSDVGVVIELNHEHHPVRAVVLWLDTDEKEPGWVDIDEVFLDGRMDWSDPDWDNTVGPILGRTGTIRDRDEVAGLCRRYSIVPAWDDTDTDTDEEQR